MSIETQYSLFTQAGIEQIAQTIANIQAAGGSTGLAQSLLTQGDAARAAGDFKGAYTLYRKAYKTAAK